MDGLQKYSAAICSIHFLYTIYILLLGHAGEDEELLQTIKKEKAIIFLFFIPVYLKAIGI